MLRPLLILPVFALLGFSPQDPPQPGASRWDREGNGEVHRTASQSVSDPTAGQPQQVGTLEGRIHYTGPEAGPIIIQLYGPGDGGWTTGRVSKADVLGGREPDRSVLLPGPGAYRFDGLSEGRYSVVAFMDLDGDQVLDFGPPEPLGWYASEVGGWIDPVELPAGGRNDVDLTLRTPTPFPRGDRETGNGALRWMKGRPVLQLQGTPAERGYAHGFLVGPQVLDFFEFYVLEDSWRSADRYEAEFVPFLQTHFDYHPDYLAEADALLQGMKDSGMDLRVEWLDRDFRRVDLLAINAYIERRAARPSPAAPGSPVSGLSVRSWPILGRFVSSSPTVPGPAVDPSLSARIPRDGPACSQFAYWGQATEGTDLGGGLIAGRNMDGEVDLRKVTVSHFLLFAVDPSEEGRYRWISTMWPGFIGTISGINEAGLYSMENAGGTGPGPVVDGLTPCTWTQREILETAGRESTPKSISEAMAGFRSRGGGSFGAGSVILWAVPYEGQAAPAFVAEGDRFGTAIREPADVAPASPWNVMATNHYLSYGVEPGRPGLYFGKEPSFSSRWRYEAGMNTLEAWTRQEKPLGTEEMRRLLQSVAHGTTEYSVIFRANEMTVDVAVDDLATDLWDAPYQEWVTFHFEELFLGMEQDSASEASRAEHGRGWN